MRTTPAFVAAALAAAAFATPTFAATTEGLSVKYSDLDLSTERGQARLERRIDKAARDVCGLDDVTSATRMRSESARACYEQAKASVHNQVAAAIARGDTRGG